ncbi:hypothetical protein [Cupriavidus basilensis]|uniref:hypothetical protein n=1 Tax=Cupriavidus basilensis TaxID=68895 RepID=UPI0039F689B6
MEACFITVSQTVLKKFKKTLAKAEGVPYDSPPRNTKRRCKADGTRVAGLAGWLAARTAQRAEGKKPVDETMITLHNLVSLLQKTQRRGKQSEPR